MNVYPYSRNDCLVVLLSTQWQMETNENTGKKCEQEQTPAGPPRGRRMGQIAPESQDPRDLITAIASRSREPHKVD